MTTYAAPPLYAPPAGPPPPYTPPKHAASRRRGRLALAGAWLAVIVCGTAAALSGFTLSRPTARPVNTVIVSPSFSAEEIAAAKQRACQAWDLAATRIVAAGADVAHAPRGWNDPVKREAIITDARVTLVETAYLNSQIGPATPQEVTQPIHDYLVATYDIQHETLLLHGRAVDAAIDRANDHTHQVDAVCGLP